MKTEIVPGNVKLFMAVGDAKQLKRYFDIFPKHKINVLISYHYGRGQLCDLYDLRKTDHIKELYLDSGAYSANKGKSYISLYEYGLFLKEYSSRFDQVFSLDDKFDDPEHNRINLKELEKQLPDVKVIPVLHQKGQLLKELKTHVVEGYKFIAIGSNHNISKQEWDKIDLYCHELKAQDGEGIKLHIFGRIEYEEQLNHRPHSADSSTFVTDAGRGNIRIWDNENKKIKHVWTNEREKCYRENVESSGTGDSADDEENVFDEHLNTQDPHLDKLIDHVLAQFKDEDGKAIYCRGDLVDHTDAKVHFNLFFYHQLEQYLNSKEAKEEYLEHQKSIKKG